MIGRYCSIMIQCWRYFGVLCGSATLPLVMVSATAPLVQGWFALIGHHRSSDPYFLYAASNAGSLLALLCYPFVIEPNLGLITQSHLWKTGFLILAILVIACGMVARRLSRSQPVQSEATSDDLPLEPTSPTVGNMARCGSRWYSYRQAGLWA